MPTVLPAGDHLGGAGVLVDDSPTSLALATCGRLGHQPGCPDLGLGGRRGRSTTAGTATFGGVWLGGRSSRALPADAEQDQRAQHGEHEQDVGQAASLARLSSSGSWPIAGRVAVLRRRPGPTRHTRRSREHVVVAAAGRGAARRHGRLGRAAGGAAGGVADRPAEARGLQVGPEGGGVLVAGLAVLGQRVQDDGVERGVDGRVEASTVAAAAADVLVGDGHRRVGLERRTTGEQLEEQAAGGVEVGAGVDVVALRLLRREVLRGADDGLRLGHRRVGVGDAPGRCRSPSP